MRMSAAASRERIVLESPIIYHHPLPLSSLLFPPLWGWRQENVGCSSQCHIRHCHTASIIIDDDDDIARGKTFGTESDGEDKRAISGSRLFHPLPEQSFSERHMIGCVIFMGVIATWHEICEETSRLTPSFPAFSTLLRESHVVMLT